MKKHCVSVIALMLVPLVVLRASDEPTPKGDSKIVVEIQPANSQSVVPAKPDVTVREVAQPGDFPLFQLGQSAPIWVDKGDFPLAQLVAKFLAEDMERVGAGKPTVEVIQDGKLPTNPPSFLVIVGTVGKSASLIDRLVSEKKLDVTPIQGRWESYLIRTVAHPFPGVDSALVIAGSDRRGTAFGTFSLSEALGVSPWVWWADVRPAQRRALFVGPTDLVQGPPSIQYRGIFINDEAALRAWTASSLQNGNKMFGPKLYSKVFELLLRLKANLLWPAMHEPNFFNHDPENKRVADEYGIVMGSSHCEQMLFNNTTEWDQKHDGSWDYFKNGEKIHAVWEKRLQDNGHFENSYTLGLRGISDRAMQGGKDIHDQIAMMEQIFLEQRALIAKYVNPDLKAVSQIFVPYREVMPLYRAGLKVPDDVTLIWCDDNYGYMRQLSTPQEQQRSGKAGVYYHLGFSHYNMWLSLFSPAQIAYELHKAYEYGANRLWVINVGDIKPAEKEITFAMQMAWDIHRWTPENAHRFAEEWAASTFGTEFAPEIAAILRDWYRLAARGNPCIMSKSMGGVFSPKEIQDRLAAFQRLGQQAEEIAGRIPPRLQDAYLHLVLYPVRALGLFNEEFSLARQSLNLAAAGDPKALEFAAKSKEANQALRKLTDRYMSSAGGKWPGMMGGPARGMGWMADQPIATEDLVAKGRAGAGVPIIMESLSEPLLRLAAKDYSKKSEVAPAHIATCSGLGFVDGVTLLPTTLPPVDDAHIQDAPWVEYKLDLPPGDLTIQIRTLPTQRIHAGRSLRFAASLDGKAPVGLDVHVDEGYNGWWQNVHRGYSHRTVNYPAEFPRQTTLRLYLLEPGVVLQDILVHPAWKKTLPADALDAANVDDDFTWDAALESKRTAHTLEGLYNSHRLTPATFQWPIKVDPHHPNRLVCTVWGESKRTMSLAIDGVEVVNTKLAGGQPGRFVDLEFLIPESLTKGKDTVMVQVKSGNILNEVFAARAEPVSPAATQGQADAASVPAIKK